MKLRPEEARSLMGKVIVFNKTCDLHEIHFEEGMKARVRSIQEDIHVSDSYKIACDFSDYEEHNKTLMTANFYDKDGQPTEKWCEAGAFYPDDRVETIYVDLVDDAGNLFELPFDLHSSNEVIREPLKGDELRARVDEDNWVEGIIPIDLDSIIENDFEGFLDIISEALCDSDLLMDVEYEVVGAEDGEILLKVKGDASTILEYLEDRGE